MILDTVNNIKAAIFHGANLTFQGVFEIADYHEYINYISTSTNINV